MRVVGEVVEDCENAGRGHLVDDTLAARATRPGCAIKVSVGRVNDCTHGSFPVGVGEAVKDGELASGSDFEDSAIHIRECSAQIGSIKIAVVAERDGLRIADVAVEREQDFIDSRGRHLIYGAGDCAPVSGGAVEVPVFTLIGGALAVLPSVLPLKLCITVTVLVVVILKRVPYPTAPLVEVVPYRLPSVARVRPYGRPPIQTGRTAQHLHGAGR